MDNVLTVYPLNSIKGLLFKPSLFNIQTIKNDKRRGRSFQNKDFIF